MKNYNYPVKRVDETEPYQKGHAAGIAWHSLGRDRPPEPLNPYQTPALRSLWSQGYAAGRSEHFTRRARAQREDEEAARLRENDRLANRTLREQIEEARDTDDLKQVLLRMLDERGE